MVPRKNDCKCLIGLRCAGCDAEGNIHIGYLDWDQKYKLIIRVDGESHMIPIEPHEVIPGMAFVNQPGVRDFINDEKLLYGGLEAYHLGKWYKVTTLTRASGRVSGWYLEPMSMNEKGKNVTLSDNAEGLDAIRTATFTALRKQRENDRTPFDGKIFGLEVDGDMGHLFPPKHRDVKPDDGGALYTRLLYPVGDGYMDNVCQLARTLIEPHLEKKVQVKVDDADEVHSTDVPKFGVIHKDTPGKGLLTIMLGWKGRGGRTLIFKGSGDLFPTETTLNDPVKIEHLFRNFEAVAVEYYVGNGAAFDGSLWHVAIPGSVLPSDGSTEKDMVLKLAITMRVGNGSIKSLDKNDTDYGEERDMIPSSISTDFQEMQNQGMSRRSSKRCRSSSTSTTTPPTLTYLTKQEKEHYLGLVLSSLGDNSSTGTDDVAANQNTTEDLPDVRMSDSDTGGTAEMDLDEDPSRAESPSKPCNAAVASGTDRRARQSSDSDEEYLPGSEGRQHETSSEPSDYQMSKYPTRKRRVTVSYGSSADATNTNSLAKVPTPESASNADSGIGPSAIIKVPDGIVVSITSGSSLSMKLSQTMTVKLLNEGSKIDLVVDENEQPIHLSKSHSVILPAGEAFRLQNSSKSVTGIAKLSPTDELAQVAGLIDDDDGHQPPNRDATGSCRGSSGVPHTVAIPRGAGDGGESRPTADGSENAFTGSSAAPSPPGHSSTLKRTRAKGLGNLGNTCFMNSILQCLAHSVPLSEFYLDEEFPSSNPGGRWSEISTKFAGLIRRMWYGTEGVADTAPFKNALDGVTDNFHSNDQHDAHECFVCIFSALHEDSNRVQTKPFVERCIQRDGETDVAASLRAWFTHFQREDSTIGNLVGCQIRSSVTCTEGRTSIAYDIEQCLSVQVVDREKMTLEECLSAFTASELVDGGFEFEKGKGKTNAWKKILVSDTSSILIIHLKRFYFMRMGANMIREKIKTNVVFPLEGLDMKQYGSDKVYDLYAVSNHHGEADDRGHYTSYCKEEDGTWSHYDDRNVKYAVDKKKVVSPDAYILFYERRVS
mmetsp:Transcript_21094/g.49508  ORF Transcript_21094/g.49508 Transcript_21094/m.49508 type:complete len:1049 (+) Transcript_21094:170-3316(+)